MLTALRKKAAFGTSEGYLKYINTKQLNYHKSQPKNLFPQKNLQVLTLVERLHKVFELKTQQVFSICISKRPSACKLNTEA